LRQRDEKGLLREVFFLPEIIIPLSCRSELAREKHQDTAFFSTLTRYR